MEEAPNRTQIKNENDAVDLVKEEAIEGSRLSNWLRVCPLSCTLILDVQALEDIFLWCYSI